MTGFNLILLAAIFVVSFFLLIVSATLWCGPTWFQRTGLCFAALSISLGAYSSDIQPEMAVYVLKPFIDHSVVVFSMIGVVIAAFGEVIWHLLHPQNRSCREIMKEFVNS